MKQFHMREEATGLYITCGLLRNHAKNSKISWRFAKECPRNAYNTGKVSYTYSTEKRGLMKK